MSQPAHAKLPRTAAASPAARRLTRAVRDRATRERLARAFAPTLLWVALVEGAVLYLGHGSTLWRTLLAPPLHVILGGWLLFAGWRLLRGYRHGDERHEQRRHADRREGAERDG